MRHQAKIVLGLLSCALWMQAQPRAEPPNPGQSNTDESRYVKLEGCLHRSGWQYSIIERDGTQEFLAGYPKLKDYVGHDIEITGVRTVKTVDNTPPGGSSSVIMQPIVNVKSVKDLGTGCPGAGN